jgi:ZIP family zinc transporter
MVEILEILLLGAIAGFTIFLGLPVVLLGTRERVRGFLNAVAIGILVFLIVDVMGSAWGTATSQSLSAFRGHSPWGDAAADMVAMFGGLALGLLGLAVYERRYLGRAVSGKDPSPYRMATMIALGIGAHNLSEGLAIGQSYVSGAIGLAVVLVVGFGVHNMTEGFGILAPLSGLKDRPQSSFLFKVLMIGGAPTFLGTVLGSLFYSSVAYVLFLTFAGGALVYVTMSMYSHGRKQTSNDVLLLGIFLGLCAGFLTDLIVTLGGS